MFELYKAACQSAFQLFYGPGDLAGKQCARVEQKFCHQFRTYRDWKTEDETASSADLHAATSQMTKILWSTSKSKKTCLKCLVRIPQHVLSCGHSICDTCFKIFGKGILGQEHKFTLSECVLCREGPSTEVMLKPPTCGSRILGIDGGGTRGVVPLEFLLLLQETLGSDCVLTDLFDFAVGTSAGKF